MYSYQTRVSTIKTILNQAEGRFPEVENRKIIPNYCLVPKYAMISTIASLVASNSINTLSPTAANTSSTNYLYSIDQNQTWTNETYPIPVFPAYIRHTSVAFCVIIMCLGVIGNVMVPVVIFRSKDMRNSTNIFLVNLSFADLMILLVCTPTVLVEVNSKPETWVLGEEMCK